MYNAAQKGVERQKPVQEKVHGSLQYTAHRAERNTERARALIDQGVGARNIVCCREDAALQRRRGSTCRAGRAWEEKGLSLRGQPGSESAENVEFLVEKGRRGVVCESRSERQHGAAVRINFETLACASSACPCATACPKPGRIATRSAEHTARPLA